MDTSKIPYIVVDIETTVKCPPELSKNKALPAWKDNVGVLFGAKFSDYFPNGKKITTVSMPKHTYSVATNKDGANVPYVYVGHNAPFDLQYIKKECPNLYLNIVEYGKIWDTQLAEYILSGQRSLFPALNDLSVKYGGTVKDDEIKKHWDAGGQTEDIDPAKLKAYLEDDVQNTERVMQHQMQIADISKERFRFILSQGNTALAIADAMYNGMCIDKDALEKQIGNQEEKVKHRTDTLSAYMRRKCPPDLADSVDVHSTAFISKFIFGGEVEVKRKIPDGFYKNGKPKTKTVMVPITMLPIEEGKHITADARVTNKNGWSIDDKVLNTLKEQAPISSATNAFADTLLSLRKHQKNLSTYLLPLRDVAKHSDFLHGNINNTATATGRFSSTNPNLQNISGKEKSDVKEVFVSRWGSAGVIVEADYKQLEIVALAYLTNCKQLKEDINNGLDIHEELFKEMYHRSPDEAERKLFKRRSFALIYGGGATSIAEQAKCSYADAKKFIKTFFDRYPEVKKFRELVTSKVNASAVAAGHDATTGLPKKIGYYEMPTGRVIQFDQYYNEWKGVMDFSATQIANYPVQSFATADIVQTVLGVLFRKLYLTESLRQKCLIINTVHDSIIFDIHKDVLKEALNLIDGTMSNVAGILDDVFGINDFDVQVVVNVTSGPNWLEQTKINAKE